MAAEFDYFPFEEGSGSDITEERWKALFSWMRTVGVLNENITLPTDDALFVSESTPPGLTVEVYHGEAFIQGVYWSHTDDPYVLEVNQNNETDPRIDLVVLRCDFTANGCEYVVIEGTADPSPTPPAPIQNSTIWDLPLAEVYVVPSAGSITNMDITDVRVRSTQGDGPASTPSLTSSGGESLVVDGVAPDFFIRGLDEGDRIDLTSSGSSITISYAPAELQVCVATNSMNTPVNDSSEVVLEFDTNIVNPTGMHSDIVSTEIFSILEDGIYNITFNAQWDTDVMCVGYVYLIIRLTRTAIDSDIARVVSPTPAVASLPVSLSVSRTIELLAGDEITFVARNDSGQNLNIVATAGNDDAESPVASLVRIST
jgi:hypothetical protein